MDMFDTEEATLSAVTGVGTACGCVVAEDCTAGSRFAGVLFGAALPKIHVRTVCSISSRSFGRLHVSSSILSPIALHSLVNVQLRHPSVTIHMLEEARRRDLPSRLPLLRQFPLSVLDCRLRRRRAVHVR